MTLNELELDVYRRLNKNSTAETNTQTRIRQFLNQRHRELVTQPDCQSFRDDVTTFATVAAQARYALPQAVARIHRIWDETNERTLTQVGMSWYRTMAPDPSAVSGDPEAFAVQGITRVATQPSAAAAIFAKSTSASDTAIVIRIEGVITGGYQQIANATLTGTTALQIGTLSTFIQIDNVYISAAAVGTVTLHQTSGAGTELARIAIGDTMPQYWTVHLWPTPSSALTLSMDYAREIRDMSQSTDEPLLPVDFHRLLVYGACADECLKLDDTRVGSFMQMWDRGVADMKYWIHAGASYRPGHSFSRGGSNLGSMYPAGRW
jgi:hypothetical protein